MESGLKLCSEFLYRAFETKGTPSQVSLGSNGTELFVFSPNPFMVELVVNGI